MTVVALIAGMVIVAAALVLNRPTPPDLTIVRATAPAGIPTSGRTLGAAGAPVVIDLYEDFQCPACARWGENVLPGLVANELASGTVKIAFHGFAFLGPESKWAEQAAWAAEKQDRFWDMWATLYANQGLRENAGAFERDRLIAMADVLGLDPVRFVADLD
ncbi:MAG: DsbA family protein, partial [Chloroflexota bacterium]|nr:DsbA family protein [Chloroflexota bacterium]